MQRQQRLRRQTLRKPVIRRERIYLNMRLAKPIRTLLQLTLLGTLAVSAVAQSSPNITPSRVRDQLNQPAATGAQQTPSTPAAAPAKPQVKTQGSVPTKAPAPAPVKAPVSPAKTATPA